MTNVIVLGGSGMLGSTVADALARDTGLRVAATVRSQRLADACRAQIPEIEWRVYDALGDSGALAAAIAGADWVVNAIGLTKPYVHDTDPAEVRRAVWGNAWFPFLLAEASQKIGAQVVQIATDCVFSGAAGRYVESSGHDPLDVYGKTKSLGEVRAPNFHLLRCSIIGPEPSTPAYLLEWLRRQPRGARVRGYTDHLWNGVTTHTFARLCLSVFGGGMAPGLQHVIPLEDVTKAELLVMLARAYGREDITITPGPSAQGIDRTLRTEHPDRNAALWSGAGYGAPPSIEAMVSELATFEPRLSGLVK